MKNILLFTLSLFLLSCSGNKNKKAEKEFNELQKQAIEMRENQIDFFLDANPKFFSGTTISGKQFNSENLIGKNYVVFIYDKNYLKKSETYDMPKEFNEIYETYKDKISFIGIVEGFVEDDKELNDYLSSSQILFEQIDNTESYEKTKKLKYNIFCTPAKILINDEGTVIHSSCGGGNNDLILKLDSIARNIQLIF